MQLIHVLTAQHTTGHGLAALCADQAHVQKCGIAAGAAIASKQPAICGSNAQLQS